MILLVMNGKLKAEFCQLFERQVVVCHKSAHVLRAVTSGWFLVYGDNTTARLEPKPTGAKLLTARPHYYISSHILLY